MLSPKMQNPKFTFSQVGGWVGGAGGGGCAGNQLLLLSPNWLKSKKKFTRGLAENFLSFWAKKYLGMVLDFEYWVARVYKVYANHKE